MGAAVTCSSGDSPASHFATSFSVGLSLAFPPCQLILLEILMYLHYITVRQGGIILLVVYARHKMKEKY